jgi:hypothetical protein
MERPPKTKDAFETTMRIPTLLVLAVLAVGGLAACAEKTQPIPELTFVHASPILLNVREAQIDSRYRSPGTAPNIEQTVNPTPEAALIKWAQQRLRAVGTQNVARFTILNAPLTAESLPKTPGFVGAFSTEPGQRWTVTVEAQLEILDDSGNRLDGYTAKVTRTRDIEEGVTYEQRSRFWYELLSATMSEFDQQMDNGIRQYAMKWLR